MKTRIDTALLSRYDRPGPRYTSYPTAPMWNERFGADDYRSALAAAGSKPDEPLSLYVHVPYCEQMCWFCGCTTVITQNHDREVPYIDTVLQEARLVREALGTERRVAQHHWGGGTPTFLSPRNIERLFTSVGEWFPLTEDAEVSIEVDPRVTTQEQLVVLRKIGFNRISMGVQDFDKTVQKAVHREQSFEQTKAIIDGSRELGFLSVNVDLIYGLPHQTTDSFRHTLDLVHELRPDRIAYYGYAHVPWLKKHQRVIPEEALPRGKAKLDLYLAALDSFQEHGYEAIGMDHFALADDELAVAARNGNLHRNFMGYATQPAEDMIAFGMSAISEVAGAFAHNYKDVPTWSAAIEQGRLPTDRGLRRSADDELRRRLILDLMCRFRVRFGDHGGRDAFQRRFQSEWERLQPMVADGLARITDDAIEVTDTGRLFVRNLCMVFDAYLNTPDSEGDSGPRFSRTV
jgi:oxygen-independent coproporphyrinogen III oxidase